MNCWEFTKCGREAGGIKVRRFGVCPAYPNHGKDCIYIGCQVCTAELPEVLHSLLSNNIKESATAGLISSETGSNTFGSL